MIVQSQPPRRLFHAIRDDGSAIAFGREGNTKHPPTAVARLWARHRDVRCHTRPLAGPGAASTTHCDAVNASCDLLSAVSDRGTP